MSKAISILELSPDVASYLIVVGLGVLLLALVPGGTKLREVTGALARWQRLLIAGLGGLCFCAGVLSLVYFETGDSKTATDGSAGTPGDGSAAGGPDTTMSVNGEVPAGDHKEEPDPPIPEDREGRATGESSGDSSTARGPDTTMSVNGEVLAGDHKEEPDPPIPEDREGRATGESSGDSSTARGPDTRQVVRGEVLAGDYKAKLEELCGNYYFRLERPDPLRASPFRGPLSDTGRFEVTMDGGPSEQLSVVWDWREPAEFVIWPLRQFTQSGPGEPAFRFDRLDNVYHRERNAVIRAIETGTNYEKAGRWLEELMALFAKFYQGEFPGDSVSGPADRENLSSKIPRYRYVMYRDAGRTAGERRDRSGVEGVLRSAVEMEREWLRSAIVYAATQSEPRSRWDLAYAMAEWAAFSRKVYRPNAKRWPSKNIESCGSGLLRDQAYCELLNEDLVLIVDYLQESAEVGTLLRGLKDGGLDSNKQFALRKLRWQREDQQVDRIKLSLLMEVLSALRDLARAEENREDGPVSAL